MSFNVMALPRRRLLVWGPATTALALLWPSSVLAHDGAARAGGFFAGFLHPLTGLDHALAMVAVGVWGAFLGRPLIVALPMLFPAAMVVGAGLAMAGAPAPPVEIGIALSVLLLGALIAAGVRAPVWLACAIVGAFAIFHGFAHGRELPGAADPVAFSAGFVLATGLLHGAGIGIGLLHAHPAGKTVARVLGGAIGLAGCAFLLGAVAR